MKIIVTDFIESDLKWEEDEMAKRGVPFKSYQLKHSPIEEVIEKSRDADLIIVNMTLVTRELVDSWKKCRRVIRHGVGYDNCDVAALTDRGIPLAYIPDYCEYEVAEQAMMLILACARKLHLSRKILERSIRAGQWDFSGIEPIYRLAGKTLGIIGCGRIGSLVYRRLQSFGFRILVCDPYLPQERVDELELERVDQKTIYRQADFITLHTPLTDETRKMINRETLSLMKPSAYLINTSRGEVVDYADLAQAIRNERIAGAALDVYGHEPPEPGFPFLEFDNVILTPHLAWYSEEAGWIIRRKIMEDIDRFLADQPPRFCANPQVLEK